MPFSVFFYTFPIIIGIAIQASMSTGIVNTNISTKQTAAGLSGGFLLWHLQSTADGLLQNFL